MTARGLLPLLALLLTTGPALGQATGGLVPPSSVPKKSADVRFEEQVGAQVPLDLVLRDENDQPITVGDCVAGKPTILVLAYYRCPTLCTIVLNGLVDVMRAFPPDYSAGNQFRVLTVSFDPKEKGELARRKKQSYVEAYGRPGADQGWRFCTAAADSVEKLTTAVGYKYEYDKVFKEYNHPAGLVILSPQGKVMRYFNGLQFDKDYRAKDGAVTTVRLSLIEAADGKGGSLIDQITLACFSFDQGHKKYTPSVRKLMRLGGALTVLCVAIGLVVAFARERRRKVQPPPTDRPIPTEGTT